MENHLIQGHASAIKRKVEEGRMKKTNTINIEMVNFENFKIKLNNKSGQGSIAELVELREYIDNVLYNSAKTIQNILNYDKQSPRYWGNLNNIELEDDCYEIIIDLTTFIPDESDEDNELPYGNDVLGKNVLIEFEKLGNKTKDIVENHHRPFACWQIKSKSKAQKLIKFIEETYVSPKVKEWKTAAKIKKVNWFEDRFEFEFKK